MSARGKAQKILLAIDDANILGILKISLEGEWFQVYSAGTAEEAANVVPVAGRHRGLGVAELCPA